MALANCAYCVVNIFNWDVCAAFSFFFSFDMMTSFVLKEVEKCLLLV